MLLLFVCDSDNLFAQGFINLILNIECVSVKVKKLEIAML